MDSDCYHRWSASGTCVKPGCQARRREGQDGPGHPAALSEATAQRIRELLAEGRSGRSIVRELHVAAVTVQRIRDAAP